MHDDQFRVHPGRAGIAIRRGHLHGALHQSGLKIDLQLNALIVAGTAVSICDNRTHMNAKRKRGRT